MDFKSNCRVVDRHFEKDMLEFLSWHPIERIRALFQLESQESKSRKDPFLLFHPLAELFYPYILFTHRYVKKEESRYTRIVD